MTVVLLVAIVALASVTFVACRRATKLEDELNFWRQEALRKYEEE